MAKTIRAIQYGCGPIGCSVVRLAVKRADIELVGAIDIDPQKVGRDLGEVAGLGKWLGMQVTNDVHGLLRRTRPDIVFLTTGSQIAKVQPQIEEIVEAGVNVLTTAEELAFPFRTAPKVAAEIDELARHNGVTVLATGINPGFLMDAWPLFMTGVCQDVEQVTAIRVQDASPRRLPFQQKIGAGRTLAEFERLVAEGALRHVGLPESAAMIAAGLGWELDEIVEEIEPVVAEREVRSQYIEVKPGQVAGVRQVAHASMAGHDVITLDFQAYLGAPDPRDEVRITGTPNMHVVIIGGTHGDIATAAIVVNSSRRVVEAPPGLMTMKDLPIVVCAGARAIPAYA